MPVGVPVGIERVCDPPDRMDDGESLLVGDGACDTSVSEGCPRGRLHAPPLPATSSANKRRKCRQITGRRLPDAFNRAGLEKPARPIRTRMIRQTRRNCGNGLVFRSSGAISTWFVFETCDHRPSDKSQLSRF